MGILTKDTSIVESVVANVALGASESQFDQGNKVSSKGKVTVNFVEYAKRHGERTEPYINLFRDAVKDIPGAEITIDKQKMGPPTGKPINIEVTGDDLNMLVVQATSYPISSTH